MEKLYSRREAASVLGIGLTALDEARRGGTIAYIQYVPNGKVYFTEAALQEFVAQSTHSVVPNVRRATYRKQWNRNR